MADLRTVGVLGCGQMGNGIAQVSAAAGYRTLVHDVSGPALDNGKKAIERSLAKFVEKGVVSAADRDAALGRLSFESALQAFSECDIVIEAVVEDLEAKRGLWAALDALCPARTIFASNTSSLSIASLAAATKRPDRFIGLHFFNPVPLMRLAEIVRTLTTSAATAEVVTAFARSLGKETVSARDSSGFLVNRLLVPYLLDAVRALEQGVGTTQDIDTAMVLGCGHPMGPLTLLDLVGIDTTCRIAEIMYDEYREERLAPPPLLRRMLVAGLYGRKTGRGFYDYAADPPTPVELGLRER